MASIRDHPGYIGPPPSGPKCDLCFIREPSWFYPAEPFTLMTPVGSHVVYCAEGGFVACDGCAALADHGDMDGLANTALGSIGKMAEVYPAANALIRKIHAALLRHANGERRKYVPEARP